MTQSIGNYFYQNWTFWAFVVAALALLLSQLPPLSDLLRRAKLDLEVYSRILVTHKVGNPNIGLQLIISNIGGKTIRIRGATVTLKCDGKHIASLPAQNYLSSPTDPKLTVLFTAFSLRPREDWNHMVNFLNFFSREDEKIYRRAESAIKNDIFKKLAESEGKAKIVEADEEDVKPFIDMHKAFFIWHPGEYEMYISIDVIPRRAAIEKKFRFTIFESDSDDLAKSLDEYKFGDGIYWSSDRPKGIIVPILEA